MAEQTYRVVWIGEEEIIASNSKQAKQIASKQLASTIDESELKIKKFKIIDCVDSKEALRRKVV
ncbi:MAG: hypothetical protein VYA01_04005 [Bacteroidota bacterium]|jgi:hypothetical protein|nr:hypothetical protein [Bacteroidota bacterium]|tara:strand:+ start:1976 stop:2167 length:192 start_codon:yes stop_codon:yes gene_type:complete